MRLFPNSPESLELLFAFKNPPQKKKLIPHKGSIGIVWPIVCGVLKQNSGESLSPQLGVLRSAGEDVAPTEDEEDVPKLQPPAVFVVVGYHFTCLRVLNPKKEQHFKFYILSQP